MGTNNPIDMMHVNSTHKLPHQPDEVASTGTLLNYAVADVAALHIPMNAKHEDGLRAAAAPGSGGCGLHQHHIRIGAPWTYTCWRGAAIDTGDLFQRWTIVSELPTPLSKIERPALGQKQQWRRRQEDRLARCGDARGKITMPPAQG